MVAERVPEELRLPLGEVVQADCRDFLKSLPDCSVSSCVTDPPYGLSEHKPEEVAACLAAWLAGERYEHGSKGFMSKAWDSFVPGPEVWREVYRVLKPGGTALVFAGSRTQDLMGIALRLAGFRIADQILAWTFLSGFPKATDISKQLDARQSAEREVVGENPNARPSSGRTAPATDLARTWDGWKSHGLKPSYEPVIVAVRPNEGSYAENAVRHGVSGLWIDGCRVPTNGETPSVDRRAAAAKSGKAGRQTSGDKEAQHGGRFNSGEDPEEALAEYVRERPGENNGRWPPNSAFLCTCGAGPGGRHDPETCACGVLDRQVGERTSGSGNKNPNVPSVFKHEPSRGKCETPTVGGDSGPASRMFPTLMPDDPEDAVRIRYCPKSPRRERDAGLEGFAAAGPDAHNLSSNACARCGLRVKSNGSGQKCECGDLRETVKLPAPRNSGPCVKPLSLMRWLVRLTKTPGDGGICLDPFAGTGSTLCACELEGRPWLGCEREPEYVAIAEARIAHWREVAAEERRKAQPALALEAS